MEDRHGDPDAASLAASKLKGVVEKPLNLGFVYEVGVLETNTPAQLLRVKRGLDRDHITGLDNIVGPGDQARRFVPMNADAVTCVVPEA